jgi:hypothetical protein
LGAFAQISLEGVPVKKFVFTVLLISILLAACAPTHTEDGLSILRVDEEHNSSKISYELEPGPGFAMELHGYKFEVPEYIPTINMIQISLGPDQTYSVPVYPDDESLYRLTAETLIPENNAIPFDGLESGDLISLGVGYWEDGKGFFVVWLGQATVK